MKATSLISLTAALRTLCAAAVALVALTAAADNPVVSLEGVYTYHGEQNDSPADCRRKAARGARIEALRRFGTVVSQVVMSTTIDTGDAATSHFLELSESEVKGEWLGDEGEPQYDMGFDSDGAIYVTCRIRGRGRELSNEAVDFEALVLRNGTERRHADTRFRHHDDMYLYFAAPLNGYVQVYLEDESRQVYNLLPYPYAAVDDVKVRRGAEYIFFDAGHADAGHGTVEELRLTAPDHIEYNKVYVIFSPNVFAVAPSHFTAEGLPPSLSSEDFSSWLIRNRRNDPRMAVKSIVLSIEPPGVATETVNY